MTSTMYLSIQQVADIFGTSRQSVLKWYNEGKFPNAMHIGGHRKTAIIISNEDAQAHCAQRIEELEREAQRIEDALTRIRKFEHEFGKTEITDD